MITACAAEETAVNTTDETTTARIEETTTSEYKSPEVNFGGAVITIGAADHTKDGYNIMWVGEKYCDAYAPEQNGDPMNDALYFRNQRVEEELNVTINSYNLGTFGTAGANLQKLIMAAEDIVDIAYMNGNPMPQYLGSGMIMDLYEIPTVDFKHSWWDQNSVKEFTLFGTLSIVTGDISLNTIFSLPVYFFNKQLVEDFKIENMYDIVRKGDWTIQKMIEISRIVGADLNGDGIMDEEDRYGMLTHSYVMIDMIYGGGVRITNKNSEGVPQLAVNTQRTADIVEMSVPYLWDKQVTVTTSDFYPKYSNPAAQLFTPMFINNQGLFYTNQFLFSMELRNMDADFGILPPPKLDAAQDGYYVTLSNYWGNYIMVPVTNGNLEMTGHVLDAMGYYSQLYVTPAYIDTTVMNKAIRDDDSADMINVILNSRCFDIATLYNWGGVYSMFPIMYNNKSTNFASEFAKIETRVQTEIDKTVEMLR